jgi:hypothetical protein
MGNKMLNRWWQPNLTESDMAALKWIAVILLIVLCAALINNAQAGNAAKVVSNFGVICMIAAYAVGPQCWKVIDAAEGSNSRKTLTLLVIFGFILNVSGLLAHYFSF